MLTFEQIDTIIDEMLPVLQRDQNSVNFQIVINNKIRNLGVTVSNQLDRVIKRMLLHNLIAEDGNSLRKGYYVTEHGNYVIEYGGWLKFCKDREEQGDLDRQIKRLQIRELKGNIFQLKYWWLLLLISTGLSALVQWIF